MTTWKDVCEHNNKLDAKEIGYGLWRIDLAQDLYSVE
jgi:hypothetical protein